MKKLMLFLAAVMILKVGFAQDLPVMTYDIDVTQNPDTFYVRLALDKKISKDNNIFQFAATAPGTYQTMNIGRLVSDFRAYDKKCRELKTEKIGVNQYKIKKPRKVVSISYQVAETFDTPVDSFPIYMMCGSSIEEDHTLINAHTLAGYFHGLQDAPVRVKLIRPVAWETGTALSETDGFYVADDFDHLVDSPILSGQLSYADTTIASTPIRIYTYSELGKFRSESLLVRMSDMLDAARKFLITLPVDRYTFLYYFLPNPSGQTGAWEHSYSSEYVLTERDPSDQYLAKVTDIAAHEFFHIVTPLNVHSEIIESFNFVSPTPSVHLWMYEGVTEWASNILLYRGGVIDLDTYTAKALERKILVNEHYYDKTWSLKKLAYQSFNKDGAKQYGNIYYKGSLVAGYLDIRLLELSGGAYGLRELMLDLIDKYGKGKPVSEETFFDDIAEMTYPEIREFFDKYVLGSEPLPHAEYLAKIGLKYERKGEKEIEITKMEEMTPQQEKLFRAWSVNLAF